MNPDDIKRKVAIAKRLREQHARTGAGFYATQPITGRYFGARVHGGRLQMMGGNQNWVNVPDGQTFTDHNGRPIVLPFPIVGNMTLPPIIGHVLDTDQFEKLRRLQTELHNGTDRERDYGHRLWLALNTAIPIREGDLK